MNKIGYRNMNYTSCS